MKTENIHGLILLGGFVGYIGLVRHIHGLTVRGSYRKAGLICLITGLIVLAPFAKWFYIGAIGYFEFAQKGGQLDMIGFYRNLVFWGSIWFSFVLGNPHFDLGNEITK